MIDTVALTTDFLIDNASALEEQGGRDNLIQMTERSKGGRDGRRVSSSDDSRGAPKRLTDHCTGTSAAGCGTRSINGQCW
jgi:hypothetical protein